MARLASTVTVHTPHRGSVTLTPDGDIAEWAIALIGSSAAWAILPTADEIASSQILLVLDQIRAKHAAPAGDASVAEAHTALQSVLDASSIALAKAEHR